nr:MAG TPA: hypothetical protein [Caudoviricetes sp.]
MRIIILPVNDTERSIRRECEIKKFGYDLQNNLFKND